MMDKMKLSVELGKVNQEGLIEIPKKVYNGMGLRPGSKINFIEIDSMGDKINPKALRLLRKIRSAKKKPSMRTINQAVSDVRKRSQTKR